MPGGVCSWPMRLRAERFAHCHALTRHCPQGHPWAGLRPRTTPSFWHAPKGCKSAPKGVPPFGIPPWGGVDGLRCLYRFSQAPSTPARESLREKLVGPTRSTRAAVPTGSPRVMPAHTQPSPACPRSSAPRGPRRGITMQSAFPTRSQKSSGALPARRAGIARGHPAGAMVRGSEACPSHFSRSDFRTIAEGACRTSLSPAQILSPGAQRGFQRGAPFDTFLLAFGVYQKRVVVRGRNPAAK